MKSYAMLRHNQKPSLEGGAAFGPAYADLMPGLRDRWNTEAYDEDKRINRKVYEKTAMELAASDQSQPMPPLRLRAVLLEVREYLTRVMEQITGAIGLAKRNEPYDISDAREAWNTFVAKANPLLIGPVNVGMSDQDTNTLHNLVTQTLQPSLEELQALTAAKPRAWQESCEGEELVMSPDIRQNILLQVRAKFYKPVPFDERRAGPAMVAPGAVYGPGLEDDVDDDDDLGLAQQQYYMEQPDDEDQQMDDDELENVYEGLNMPPRENRMQDELDDAELDDVYAVGPNQPGVEVGVGPNQPAGVEVGERWKRLSRQLKSKMTRQRRDQLANTVRQEAARTLIRWGNLAQNIQNVTRRGNLRAISQQARQSLRNDIRQASQRASDLEQQLRNQQQETSDEMLRRVIDQAAELESTTNEMLQSISQSVPNARLTPYRGRIVTENVSISPGAASVATDPTQTPYLERLRRAAGDTSRTPTPSRPPSANTMSVGPPRGPGPNDAPRTPRLLTPEEQREQPERIRPMYEGAPRQQTPRPRNILKKGLSYFGNVVRNVLGTPQSTIVARERAARAADSTQQRPTPPRRALEVQPSSLSEAVRREEARASRIRYKVDEAGNVTNYEELQRLPTGSIHDLLTSDQAGMTVPEIKLAIARYGGNSRLLGTKNDLLHELAKAIKTGKVVGAVARPAATAPAVVEEAPLPPGFAEFKRRVDAAKASGDQKLLAELRREAINKGFTKPQGKGRYRQIDIPHTTKGKGRYRQINVPHTTKGKQGKGRWTDYNGPDPVAVVRSMAGAGAYRDTPMGQTNRQTRPLRDYDDLDYNDETNDVQEMGIGQGRSEMMSTENRLEHLNPDWKGLPRSLTAERKYPKLRKGHVNPKDKY